MNALKRIIHSCYTYWVTLCMILFFGVAFMMYLMTRGIYELMTHWGWV